MQGKTGSRVRRSLLALAGLSLVVAATGIGAADAQERGPLEPGPRPDVFKGGASAAGVEVYFDRRGGVLPVQDLFRYRLLFGEGTYESSDVGAQSATVYPGSGLILGPNLVCSQIPADAGPFKVAADAFCAIYSFPLLANADETRPEDSSTGAIGSGRPGEPVRASSASATAEATDAGVYTDAAIQDYGMSFAGVPAFTVDSATARTSQYLDESGNLIVVAESTVTGVDVAGVLHIGSVISRSRSVFPADDPESAVSTSSTEVSGASVAGVPVQITDQGIVVGDPSGPVPVANQLLNDTVQSALSNSDTEAFLVGAEQGSNDAGFTFGQASGVRVLSTVDLGVLASPGSPEAVAALAGTYEIDLLVGAVGTRAFATNISAPDFTPPAGGGSSGVGGGSFGGGGGGGLTPSVGGGVAPNVGNAPALPDPSLADEDGFVPTSLRDLLPGRLEALYLAFTLTALALCISPRLLVPPRLPGGRA